MVAHNVHLLMYTNAVMHFLIWILEALQLYNMLYAELYHMYTLGYNQPHTDISRGPSE